MKKSLPKFLLTHNEFAKSDGLFVVHTQEPSFAAEIITFDSLEERNDFQQQNHEKEMILVTNTTLLVIVKYLESSDRLHRREFLNKRISHWVVANVLNTSGE